MSFESRVIDCALKYLGHPYIWGGKGQYVWTPRGPAAMATAGCPSGFDCIGLVLRAAREAGSQFDLTQLWNAQTVLDRVTEDHPGDEVSHLALYGPDFARVEHIAIELGNTGLLLQAAGGGHTTTSYTEAVRTGACVSLSRRGRKDILGYRSIAALEKARP